MFDWLASYCKIGSEFSVKKIDSLIIHLNALCTSLSMALQDDGFSVSEQKPSRSLETLILENAEDAIYKVTISFSRSTFQHPDTKNYRFL